MEIIAEDKHLVVIPYVTRNDDGDDDDIPQQTTKEICTTLFSDTLNANQLDMLFQSNQELQS